MPERRNVYDNDELDSLSMDVSRLHFGKKEEISAPAGQTNKSAILSALAAFDADDDERDDTYDAQDVGGSIDNAHPDGEPGQTAKVTQEENDMALFTSYKSSPELFGRTFDVRRGQARAALKAETGMTDEAIEGWAIMLQRDPKRLNRLESQLGAFDGRQGALARTSYRESPGGTETEDSDAPGGRGGFGGRGRGRGRGGRGGRGGGRGGSVAGPSGDASTVAAQRRKEANKGSQANHNRKAQRGKKMARGGFPGA
jgi:activating signal cointegrator complex subunit 2